MTPFGEGIWLDTEPVSILGMPLAATMTVLRLTGGELLVHSPVAMTKARRSAVDALGTVSHLYAPNLYHHRWIGDWAAEFPSARLHAPSGLTKKRAELRIDRHHDVDAEPAFADHVDLVDEVPIEGFRLQETALLYRPAGALVVADLVHNVGRPRQLWSRLYTRAMGFYDRVALSRMIRWLAFSDRLAARRSVERLLALPFDRLVVGHGTPVSDGAKEALADAFSWLLPEVDRAPSDPGPR